VRKGKVGFDSILADECEADALVPAGDGDEHGA
jgi:hypothetical protein